MRDASTIMITALGVLIGLTRLRGKRWLRLTYQVLVIGCLADERRPCVAGVLARSRSVRISVANRAGLSLLSVAAIAVPITSGRNVYCSHICPHGAVQQWSADGYRGSCRSHRRLLAVFDVLPGCCSLGGHDRVLASAVQSGQHRTVSTPGSGRSGCCHDCHRGHKCRRVPVHPHGLLPPPCPTGPCSISSAAPPSLLDPP